jgi:hypothetical protein
VSVGGYLTSISAAINGDGRLEVFGANAHQPNGQNNIYNRWQTSPGGSWSNWAAIAGYLTGVSATTNADGRLEVFGVNEHVPDGQNNVFHKWQRTPGTSWSNWTVIPGYLTSIGAGRNADGRLEIWGANGHQPNGQNDIYNAWQQTPSGSISNWNGVVGYLG